LVAGFSWRAASTAAAWSAAAAATAATNKTSLRRSANADAVISEPTGNAAAFSAEPTVKLALSAVSAGTTRDENAIFWRASANAQVGRSSPALRAKRTGSMQTANAPWAAAVVTAAVTVRRSAD
jgi:hypothetical protein